MGKAKNILQAVDEVIGKRKVNGNKPNIKQWSTEEIKILADKKKST